ncbi:MAG: extracellular solute-binding protein [Herbinix sp.]|jgi:raffinose/stachyose/melibiose transport system substrate-binding protein|nr:extracellular solute-binding protein [Herbinix sp.]
MKIKKLLALSLAAAMVISLLAGCGGTSKSNDSGEKETLKTEQGAEKESSEKEESTERQKVVISTYLSDPSQVEVRAKYLDTPLREAFPNVDIEFKMYNDRQSLQVEIAGGGGPDIIDLDGPTSVAEYARAERVMDLEKYSAQYGWKDVFYEWAYNSSLFKGKLYSLPTSFEGMVMYYNMDVLNENGWTIPKTLTELETLMKNMQEKDIIPLSFGNSNYQGAVDWLYSTFLSCNAGPDNLKKALYGDIKFDDPVMVEAMNQMVTWWQAGYIGDKASQTITDQDMVAFFAEGRAGMMINGTWATSQLLTVYPDCNWQADMFPEFREGVGQILPFATGGSYAINANSQNPDLAAEILNYIFTSKDRHYKSILEANYQPYPLADFDLSKLQGMNERVLFMYEVLDKAQADNAIGFCAWTFFPTDTRVYMNENTDALFLGSLTVEDYLATAQKSVDAAIADGSTPVLP